MKAIAIGLSGKIGSGKSTTADGLSRALQCLCGSFGAYVRSVATNRGLSHEREVLQQVGAELLEDLGARGLTKKVLDKAGWSPGTTIVVEGVRHVTVAEALRAIVSPMPFVLVFVEADESVRQERILLRDGLKLSANVERHSTEIDVQDKLRGLADVVVSASQSLEDVVELIRQHVSTL